MTDKKTSLSDEEKIRTNANQRALQDVLRMHICEQIHLPDSLVHLGMHKAGEEYAMETQTAHLRNLMAVTGANARHQKTRAIKAEAIRLYREQQWPSMRQAAKSIVPKIQAFCDHQNYPRLSSDRDLQTIYEWIRSASRT